MPSTGPSYLVRRISRARPTALGYGWADELAASLTSLLSSEEIGRFHYRLAARLLVQFSGSEAVPSALGDCIATCGFSYRLGEVDGNN